MTIVLPNSLFVHIPKTGGSWVSEMLSRTGLCLAQCVEPHPFLRSSPGRSLPAFGFVRDPRDWWPSYFRYKHRHGWTDGKAFDDDCRAETFAEFLLKAADRHWGYYSRLLPEYVGPPEAPIRFVGRTENLAADLVAALDAVGEAYRPDFPKTAYAARPRNVTKGVVPIVTPPWYEELIRDMDADAFARFGYS